MEDDLDLEMMDLIDQMAELERFRKAKGIEPGDQDKYGFPYESFDAFSTEPLIFAETGMRLQTEAIQTFDTMRYLNRYSPLYIQMSKQMVKLVSLLGSCCITRAVLEQQGCDFSILEFLSIEKLREMTAFNFRKITSAYTAGIMLYNYHDEMLDLSIRWAALDARLKATQEKIDKIRSGEVRMDVKAKCGTPAASEQSVPDKKTEEREKDPAPFAPQARALPVDKAAVREFEQQQSEEQFADAVSTIPEDLSGVPGETSEIQAEGPETDELKDPDPDFTGEDPSEGISDDDEWDSPYISDELIRRMADYWQRQAMVPVMERWEAPP